MGALGVYIYCFIFILFIMLALLSCFLRVVTHIRVTYRALLPRPHHDTRLHFHREKNSASSSLVGLRRVRPIKVSRTFTTKLRGSIETVCVQAWRVSRDSYTVRRHAERYSWYRLAIFQFQKNMRLLRIFQGFGKEPVVLRRARQLRTSKIVTYFLQQICKFF